MRIDSDEYRSFFKDYTGANSDLFQAATSIIAEKIHDFALTHKQSFVFDGTLTNIEKARMNIKRSLNKKRFVQIIYVYQDPIQAWKFVQKREQEEERRIAKDVFISQYFCARKNVNILKSEFGTQIKVDLIMKNIDGTNFAYFENVDNVDRFISERYSEDVLNTTL